jgi:hypothetical protein
VLQSGCGVLVEPGNGHEIASAILDLLRVPEARTRMGYSGRQYMEVELSGAAVLGGIAGRIEALVVQG